MSKKIPIVVVAYNRAKSLYRLLTSLNAAEYLVDDIPLIISIDRGEHNQDVLEVANEFVWKHGEKTVVYQKENLKLRKHILKCGDYALEYGNVIILEDDLFVSKYFYQYAESALAFSDLHDRIGGVSLYNHRFNVEASEPFEAIDDGYDNWYFQFASSWGEAWTEKQWRCFKEWYVQTPNVDNRNDVPEYVRGWPKSSWLKYFIAYLVEKDKYFIYPKKSLTTNFGEAGTHVNMSNTTHQVPLQNSPIRYRFSTLEESSSIYDAYFESVSVSNKVINDNYVAIDLYGKKDASLLACKYRYILSRNALPYKIEKRYGCDMRPHEENILHNITGNDFFLYDTDMPVSMRPHINRVGKVQYNLRYIDRSQYITVIHMFIKRTIDGAIRRYNKTIGSYFLVRK